MPLYRNFYKRKFRKFYKQRKPRRRFRRRRFRGPFRYGRRRPWVRRKFYKYKKNKKLKRIILTQWQPSHIKKCRIKGTIQLFQAGLGRYSYNYTMYKESYVPQHEPGGGGWCYLMFSLGNLYTENQRLQNWWTVSNKGLNLVRYRGVKIKFYRQKHTDYVVTWSNEYPMEVGKYHFPSLHPQRMLQYNHKIVVPSYDTLPQSKKPYKKVFIPPPKEMVDKWYFQQFFQRYPLVLIAAGACSLSNMYVGNQAMSNNCTVNCLNTKLFQHKCFQYQGTVGYTPKGSIYLYGAQNGNENDKVETLTFLGNSMKFTSGKPMSSVTNWTNYTKDYWGNPFHSDFMNEQRHVYMSNIQPSTLFQQKQSTIKSTAGLTKVIEPLYYECRYNPCKDDGVANEVYWVKNFAEEKGWDTNDDPDLEIHGFPLWICLWGWYDWSKKLNKAKNIYQDYTIVIKTRYMEPKLPAYVLLNDEFPLGLGDYDTPTKKLTEADLNYWFPRWKFQKEAVETLLMTGTAVCRPENARQIQAHCGYTFYFKWGGNPASMEQVVDPTTQPQYPVPSGLFQSPEIVDPSTSIFNYLYNFDVRRHLLTQTAEKRIKNLTDFDISLFTDGTTPTPFEPPIQTPQTWTEETSEEEKKTLLQQLHQLQQHNLQLLQRYQQLKLMTQST
nr:MAG: ORF1 [TTV-like mini virus]